MTLKPSDKEPEKPMCFGTYVGEGDMLCAKCEKLLKKECIQNTSRGYF